MKLIKTVMNIIALITCICIFFTSCNVSSRRVINTPEIINTEKGDIKFHTSSGNIKTLIKNEFIDLIMDMTTQSIIIKDKDSDYEWSALPKKENKTASMFNITLYNKNGIYNLNTQDHSVAISTSTYIISDNTLKLTYILSDNKGTANKAPDELTSDDVYVKFSVDFILNAQSLKLRINMSDIILAPNSFISEISVMPYFGSSYNDNANDYFLVPDGSGAVMNLSSADISTDNITVNVYGQNPFYGTAKNNAHATVPVYGAKRSDSAFAAIITDGDALATINANRSTREIPSNIFSSFIITETYSSQENRKTYSGESYRGIISLTYKFLSKNNANYSAMALAAKEEMIANGILSSEKTKINDTIPFCITLIGESDNKLLTTTQQATDIMRILKGKGINNIFLNYKGLLSGGLSQKNLYSASVINSLGGKEGLETLHRFTEKQNCVLNIGTNILSSSKKYSAFNKSESILNDDTFFMMNNDMSFYKNESNRLATRIGSQVAQLGKEKSDPSIYSQTENYTMYLQDIDNFEKSFSSYIEKQKISGTDGITVTDAGRVLYSDSTNTRQESMKKISALIKAASNHGKLGIEGGNLYTLYNADIVLDMNFDTFYPESISYEPVPFVQQILHGSMLYTGKPIDAGDPLYRYNMLRYIEYGAVPSYEWIYERANIYCYSAYLLSEKITEIVDFYNETAEIFSDIADENIVEHKKIDKDALSNPITGVYCTTYSDGTEIYVNYSGNIVTTIDNVVIGPFDYAKVKR